jgi:hypothetical protein
VDRRDFLRLSVAAGVATVLGCGKAPESESALPAAPQSRAPTAPALSDPKVDSVADLANALGKDTQRIFSFVRDSVRYEPYAGVLRGAIGTMVGRTGNSADQSLLLAALLNAAGTQVRFAIGALTDDKARALKLAGIIDATTLREEQLAALAADARSSGGTTAAHPVSAESGGNPDRYAIPVDVIRATARRQFDFAIEGIESALKASGTKIAAAWTDVPDQERRRHVWAQARTESGWLDLDPSFPGAPAGVAHGTVEETVETLPDELRHRVTFIVITETWTGGKLVQAPIFEYGASADELAGASVCFTHVKAADLKSLSLLGSGRGTRYVPVLEVGSRLYAGDAALSFGVGGEDTGATGGTFVDALGGGGPEGPPDGETMAEWLEVRISAPGEETHSAVRTVFDRVWEHRGDDGTVDANAISSVEFIDFDSANREFLPCRAIHAFSVASGPQRFANLAQGNAASELGPLAWPAHAYHLVRDAVTGEIAPNLGVRSFVNAPGVVSFSVELIAGATQLDTVMSFDIWHRRFGVLPVEGREAVHAPLMVAGILSHVAERCLSFDGFSSPVGPRDGGPSVGAIFEKAALQNIATRVVRGSLPQDLPFSREARFLLDEYLRAGAIAIIPEHDVDDRGRIGWWLVNPDNGWTVDRMDDGRGAGFVEYVTQNLAVALRVASCVMSVTSVLATIYQYVANKLSKVSNLQNEILSWVQMVTGVVGLVTGAGCVSSKWVPRSRPPPPRLPRGPLSKAAARYS